MLSSFRIRPGQSFAEITNNVITRGCQIYILIFLKLTEYFIDFRPKLRFSVFLVKKHLHMYRQIMHTFRGLHDRFAHGRMGVHYAAELVGGGFEGHADAGFGE